MGEPPCVLSRQGLGTFMPVVLSGTRGLRADGHRVRSTKVTPTPSMKSRVRYLLRHSPKAELVTSA